MADDDPFRTLGIEPTLDRGAIKRAYFTALQRVPPQRDPAAFQRLRSAYESLRDRRGLWSAWVHAPLDADANLARWSERFSARIEAEAERATPDPTRGLSLLIERCERTRLR